MKKTLLATALLAGFAAAGAAQAEMSVTLYGVLDTGYGYQNFKYDHGNTDLRAQSSGLRSGLVNGNRWGLKGAEDLGGGLHAIFQLENGFDPGSGSLDGGNMFNRQALVGLSSDNWGMLTMGRQYSAAADTFNGDDGVGLGDYNRVFDNVGLVNGTRINNSFKYTTPSLGGFKGVLLYGTGSTAGSSSTSVTRLDGASATDLSDRGSRLSVGASYVNGPLGLGAAYDRQSVYPVAGSLVYSHNSAGAAQASAPGNVDAMTSWNINGRYDFGVVRLSLMFGQDRNGKMAWGGDANSYDGLNGKLASPFMSLFNLSNGYQNFKSNNYHVELSAPVGSGRLFVFYNGSHSNLGDADKWGSEAGNINAYQLQYQYPLSKRTMIYAYGTYMQNVGYLRDLKGTDAGIGLNHKF
jgi:predicted porin